MASKAIIAEAEQVRLAHLERRARSFGEDESRISARRTAAALLDPLVLPGRARHLWRYTDPRRFVPASDPTIEMPLAVTPSWQISPPHAGAGLIAGGALRAIEVGDEARAAGVEIVDLHTADDEGLFGSIVTADHGFVEALNAAAWTGGVLIRVPDGVHLGAPIAIRVVAGGAAATTMPRILIIAGPGSEFEVVEVHVEGGAGNLVLGVTELALGAGALVRYGLVQRWEPGVAGHLTARARLAAGARLQTSFATFGGDVCKVDLGVVLAGEGAEAETFGVALGAETQHFDQHTEHIHEARHTRSNLHVKVALTGAARSVYTGMIRIAATAAGSEAYQENRNLLLSRDARAETIPELEILTDDVKCSHGATVAPLEPEQLFYLRSRGLPASQAQRLIVYGFLDETLQRLPNATRERIGALIAARLHED
ncbi:MAG: Fe-S cluster assembly protein SufD [Acidobacteria bacterium]|nr:Fe-S cluster assembly protein SufD [Acidobacteriota bacterium]